jgi:hypothetical protein
MITSSSLLAPYIFCRRQIFEFIFRLFLAFGALFEQFGPQKDEKENGVSIDFVP